MDEAREAAKKGLDLGVAALRHASWWLQWQTDRHACREAVDLSLLRSTATASERPAA